MRCTNSIKGKLGDEKIISVYWFVILFLVASAIVYMTASFYGKPYDARQLEADLLTNKVAGCISSAGYLNEKIFSQEFKDDFPGSCSITFNVEDSYGKDQEQYYIRLTLSDFSSKARAIEVEAGNTKIVSSCGLKGAGMPVCLKRSFYIIDKENKQYQADIFSVIRKTEKNAQ